MARLLVVDDDPNICRFLTQLIQSMGHDVSVVHTLKDCTELANTRDYDLILLDLELPDGNGLRVLPDLLRMPSAPEVIIITGTGGLRGAEMAFKYGAWDYVQKPFVFDEVTLPITRALQYCKEKKTDKTPVALNRSRIIGESPAIRNCLEDVARASVTDAGVLITGETGTGKELFARAIHENSKRSARNFVPVDCAALPETLVESILFGHEKGAFTGAEKKREGLIVQAEGGTLFLDEIGELPPNIQKSLLRTLQERRIRPIGSTHEVAVNFRLVAATNRVLEAMTKESKFREDLLFRIRAIEIKLPPLRDRGQDIVEIIINKIHQLAQRYDIGTKGISPEFLEILNAHNWPGNVRELVNVLEYALASAGQDPILIPKHLPPEYRIAQFKVSQTSVPKTAEGQTEMEDTDSPFPTLAEYRVKTESKYLRMLLEKAKGDREEACRLSGMSQSRLYGLLKKYNLSRFGSS